VRQCEVGVDFGVGTISSPNWVRYGGAELLLFPSFGCRAESLRHLGSGLTYNIRDPEEAVQDSVLSVTIDFDQERLIICLDRPHQLVIQ